MSMRSEPPKWVIRLIRWWVKPHLLEEIEGDLYELFEEHLQEQSPSGARRKFIWNALRFCRLSNFRKNHLKLYPMLWKNYLKIAWRQMQRDKLYAAINILGIAVGIASFLLVFFYILTENSFDRHHPHADRIYRVNQNYRSDNGEVVPLAYSFNPLSRTLEDHLGMVEKTCRIFNVTGSYGEEGGQFTNPDDQNRHIEDGLYFADSTFFEMFQYTFIEGNPQRALDAPFSIVLKASVADKYFEPGKALGRVLEFRDDENSYRFTVGGVVDDRQAPSHFSFNLLASFSSLRTIMPWIDNWYHPPVYHYVQLRAGTNPDELQTRLTALPQQVFQNHLAEEVTFDAVAVTDIHLHSHREGELQPNNHVSNLRLFGLIGLFILLIACINYINLATARASTRMKEVSVRKIFGAERNQLIQQFLGESFYFTAVGLLLGLLLVRAGLPFLNGYFGTSIAGTWLLSWQTPFFLFGILLLVTFLAGLYPSIFLSAMHLGRNLKGYISSSLKRGLSVRKGLVIFQFAISCALIAATLLIHQQVTLLQSKQLGFKQEQVIIFPLRDQSDQINSEVFKADLLQKGTVLGAASTSGYPGGRGFSKFFITPKAAALDSLNVITLTVDHDFVETFGLSISAGRDFSTDFTTDSEAGFLINEALANRLGWAEPVGQEIVLTHYYQGEKRKKGRVVGVVQDFHLESLRESIEPMIFHILPRSYFYNYLAVKVTPSHIDQTLAQLETRWKAFNPERTFEYFFLDEAFAQLHAKESRFNELFKLFTVLAVLLACSGLFALAAFTAERRSKEMAVRKVLGASNWNILLQLSGQHARLAVVATLIATPVAWYFARQWLDHFAYRIDLSWWIFFLAGISIIGLAVITSSFHAIKAATSSPAKKLKQEE